MSDSHRLAWTICGGLACLLLLLMTFTYVKSLFVSWEAAHSDPWNSEAIQATFTGLKISQADASDASVIFSYDIKNTTAGDFQLTKGSSVVVMGHLKSDDTLSSNEPVALTSSVLVPAKNHARISLQVTKPFDWPATAGSLADARFRRLIADSVTDTDQFVLFDQNSHYQVNLPGGWPDMEQASIAAIP
jgi:hypothetical protein